MRQTPPSLLLRGARLIGSMHPEPVDVLVARGRIERIAPSIEHPDAEPIDFDGRFLGPGLWDHHVHMGQWALVRDRLDVSAARSAAEARAIVAGALADRCDDDLIVGAGFRDALWPDHPTGALLEFGEVPVVLQSADLHCVWGNRAAFDRLGRPDAAAGLLREQEAYDIGSRLANVGDRVLDRLVARAAAEAASRGVVGIVDFEMADAPAAWARRIAAGTDLLRIEAAVYPDALDAAHRAGHRTGTPIEGSAGLAHIGPMKIFADGSLNTRTAYCRLPYADGEPSRGTPAHTATELLDLVTRARDSGFLPAVHAIGDQANTMALDAFEAAGCAGRIEHAQLLVASDVPRFARLRVTASVQPEHALDDREVTDELWGQAAGDAYPFASLTAAGAVVRFGSDAPVAPLDPWVAMSAAVFRTKDELAPWHPDERVTFEVALEATAGRPSVAVGDRADLIVVDADPARADAGGLRRMPVAATLLAGRFTHRAL